MKELFELKNKIEISIVIDLDENISQKKVIEMIKNGETNIPKDSIFMEEFVGKIENTRINSHPIQSFKLPSFTYSTTTTAYFD